MNNVQGKLMTPKTAERREELKGALIEAAERVIGTRGLEALRARDLATEVGCAIGAIYNVFPNLDALIIEVNARTLRSFERYLADAAKTPPRSGENPAIAELVQLALVYLAFAVAQRPRWRALFEHRMAEPGKVPAWYLDEQARLFGLVERPLARLRPDLDDKALMLLAGTLFSGVHGIVSLGLDEKLIALPAAALEEELRKFVRLVGLGLVVTPAGSQ
jgi:AcrR family transcriptional regulator